MAKNKANTKCIKDHSFIHETAYKIDNTYWTPYQTDKCTKVELAVMVGMDGLTRVKDNISKMRVVSYKHLFYKSNKDTALHLVYQYKKDSTHKFTEIKKEFIKYNNAVYLIRLYKFVWSRCFKIEVTKSPLSKFNHIRDKETTVKAMDNIMKKIIKWSERYLFPMYTHTWNFSLKDDFIKNWY